PVAWQGMKSWDGELFRPLLPFTKQQILDFCESEAIPFRIDESNERSDFARNLIRNEFSDNMDELLPGWKQNVLDLARHGKTYETAVNLIAQQVFKKNTIKLKKYDALPELLKPAILKSIFDQMGLEGDYSKGQLEELADLESLQTGKSLHVGSFQLTRDREVIHLHPNKDARRIKKKITREEAKQIWNYEGISLILGEKSESGPALQLDDSLLIWPLTLRNWESGDSFTPLGMSGSQKISDHLTNRKIPTISREKALVLCGSDGTIYAIIYPLPANNGEWGAISEMAKKTPKSQTFLTINIS
ncbi:MAG: tRNA lysidine(34) synthetase TilS, partial [Balneolaceae bacterium]